MIAANPLATQYWRFLGYPPDLVRELRLKPVVWYLGIIETAFAVPSVSQVLPLLLPAYGNRIFLPYRFEWRLNVGVLSEWRRAKLLFL